MQVRLLTRPTTSRRPARQRPRRRSLAEHAVEIPGQRLEARARRAGGPQDNALYGCACGLQFMAAVSTTVGCPHCGEHQAW